TMNGVRCAGLFREERVTPKAQERFEAAAARYRATGLWKDETLVQHARARLADDAERIALIEGERSWTFRQLWDEARAVYSWLSRHNIKRGDVVSYQLPNWYESVVLNLACVMGGFVINP